MIARVKMSKTKDVIDGALAHLQKLRDCVAEVEGLEERVARARADLASVNGVLAERKSQLAGLEGEYARANAAAHKAHEEEMFRKRGELRDLAARVERLRADETSLVDGNRNKELQLRNFESAIEEAKRRIN
jgi:chromosome segregation ATPase